MANLYSQEDLFTITHSLWGKIQKPAQNDNIWLAFVLWMCFLRQPPVQDDQERLSYTDLIVTPLKKFANLLRLGLKTIKKNT